MFIILQPIMFPFLCCSSLKLVFYSNADLALCIQKCHRLTLEPRMTHFRLSLAQGVCIRLCQALKYSVALFLKAVSTPTLTGCRKSEPIFPEKSLSAARKTSLYSSFVNFCLVTNIHLWLERLYVCECVLTGTVRRNWLLWILLLTIVSTQPFLMILKRSLHSQWRWSCTQW